MILYFSATGNCKYVAQRIKKAVGQETVFIPEAVQQGRYDFEDYSIGIISPTYNWGLPSIMKEFLSKASFHICIKDSVFIDPPYNTGNDFIYRDDFKLSEEEYEDGIGVYDEDGDRLFKNTDTNGKFHSDWCSMIYSRLLLALNLLNKYEGQFSDHCSTTLLIMRILTVRNLIN